MSGGVQMSGSVQMFRAKTWGMYWGHTDVLGHTGGARMSGGTEMYRGIQMYEGCTDV